MCREPCERSPFNETQPLSPFECPSAQRYELCNYIESITTNMACSKRKGRKKQIPSNNSYRVLKSADFSFTLNASLAQTIAVESGVRIACLFGIFLFLISPFPFLAQCHMFYWWAVHWYCWLVQAVGEWPLMWAIKGLALAIWGSRRSANAFMRARSYRIDR